MNYYDYYYNDGILNRGAATSDESTSSTNRRSSNDQAHNPIHPKDIDTVPITVSRNSETVRYSAAPDLSGSPADDVIPVRTFSGVGLLSGAAGVGASVAHQAIINSSNKEGRSRSVSQDRTMSRDRATSSNTRQDAIRALNEP